MSHVPKGVLTSQELADVAGFDRRHIPRKAAKGEIPDARRTKNGCHWEFPVTHSLRGWICFYRVRHSLLRKQRSWGEDQTLKAWGTNWRYALQTFDFLRTCPAGMNADCGNLRVFSLGPDTTWEAVEAGAKLGLMPREDWATRA
jgi:hypothetical protein